jgi:hypothetical protein
VCWKQLACCVGCVAAAPLLGCPISDLSERASDASPSHSDASGREDSSRIDAQHPVDSAGTTDAGRDATLLDAGHDAYVGDVGARVDADSGRDGGPSRFAGLFDGKSFQGLSLNDGVRTYTTGTATGGFCDIVGSDLVYGNSEPRSPYTGSTPNGPVAIWGGSATSADSIQLNTNALSDCTRAIVLDHSVPLPLGVSNQVLEMTFVAPNETNVGGVSGDNPFNEFDFYTSSDPSHDPQGMLYFSRWMWLQSDMATRTPFEAFGVIASSTAAGESVSLNIVAEPYNGVGASTPVWTLTHVGAPSGMYEVYAAAYLSPTSPASPIDGGSVNPGGQLYKAPVPLGEWFRLEVAWNRRDTEGEGWVWMALTVPGSSDPSLAAGVTVYASRGAFPYNYDGMDPETIGWNPYNADSIAKVTAFMAQSDLTRSGSSPFSQRLTNIEVWTGWPASGATLHPESFK